MQLPGSTAHHLDKMYLEYKKEIKGELSLDGIEGMNLKISKFKIEKNKMNSPALDLKLAANMFNINWDMEIYAYLKNNNFVLSSYLYKSAIKILLKTAQREVPYVPDSERIRFINSIDKKFPKEIYEGAFK